jgi:hypothetical protein
VLRCEEALPAKVTADAGPVLEVCWSAKPIHMGDWSLMRSA